MINWQSVKIFLRAQVSAFSGGLTDYGLMILFTEKFHVHFAISILISGTVGGGVNFCINRFWAFRSHQEYEISATNQFIRVFSAVLGIISLKSAGTYLLHRTLKLDYRIARLLVDSIVSYGFNYPLMKFWVFCCEKNQTKENQLITAA